MCGIAGIAVQEDLPDVMAVQRMAAALIHRGPDSQDVRDLGGCILANTRLAIVDLSTRGHMPMCNEDATVWITYNGECYNSEELHRSLTERGHSFRSTTDTEVILHLYEEFGEGCVEKLRGMFAFAIWDNREKKLFLARDRLGIKPLYFTIHPGSILFASEIKALLASGAIRRQVDLSAIRAFLQLGHIPPPWTAIADIRPLQPGRLAIWRDGQFTERVYWKLPVSAKGPFQPAKETSAQLRDILLESCRLQLMSDVPIALFLSGGTDSAVLGALMRMAGANSLTGLTIGFEDRQFDESESSRETAGFLQIAHRVIQVDPGTVLKGIDEATVAMDQPTVDGLNAYWISYAAANAGFKVALSGQGGDELFGGYDSLAWFDRFVRVAKLLRFFPRAAGRGLFDHDRLPFRWRKLSYLVGADDPFVAAQLAVRLLFLDKDVGDLLDPALANSEGSLEATSFLSEIADDANVEEIGERIAFLDFRAHLESRLLRDGDAMSMAHSVEVRPILLDHRIVEFVMSLPMSARLQKKKLLLNAARECVPEGLFLTLARRPKRTFTFPFARWLGANLRAEMNETFHSDRVRAGGLLNANRIQRLWSRYLVSPQSVGWSRIWSLFVLIRWCEAMKVGT